MNFSAFSSWRQEKLLANPELIDAGCTNLYRHLFQSKPDLFGPIAPSSSQQAPHRCHVAEAFVAHAATLGVSMNKADLLISHGVRASLSVVFDVWAKEQRTLVCPGDVYPVYSSLAASSGVSVVEYTARQGLPCSVLRAQKSPWGLLVCDPLKPWGGSLSSAAWEELLAIAHRTNGQVVVDGAYSLQPSQSVQQAVQERHPVAFLGSLSKGWLLPGRSGCVWAAPTIIDHWRPAFQPHPTDRLLLSEGFAALTEHPERPLHVHHAIQRSRVQALALLAAKGIAVTGGEGYFLTSSEDCAALLAHGILALPPSVFGSLSSSSPESAVGCILSTLNMSASNNP